MNLIRRLLTRLNPTESKIRITSSNVWEDVGDFQLYLR